MGADAVRSRPRSGPGELRRAQPGLEHAAQRGLGPDPRRDASPNIVPGAIAGSDQETGGCSQIQVNVSKSGTSSTGRRCASRSATLECCSTEGTTEYASTSPDHDSRNATSDLVRQVRTRHLHDHGERRRRDRYRSRHDLLGSDDHGRESVGSQFGRPPCLAVDRIVASSWSWPRSAPGVLGQQRQGHPHQCDGDRGSRPRVRTGAPQGAGHDQPEHHRPGPPGRVHGVRHQQEWHQPLRGTEGPVHHRASDHWTRRRATPTRRVVLDVPTLSPPTRQAAPDAATVSAFVAVVEWGTTGDGGSPALRGPTTVHRAEQRPPCRPANRADQRRPPRRLPTAPRRSPDHPDNADRPRRPRLRIEPVDSSSTAAREPGA